MLSFKTFWSSFNLLKNILNMITIQKNGQRYMGFQDVLLLLLNVYLLSLFLF
jgi:hypothetical protein